MNRHSSILRLVLACSLVFEAVIPVLANYPETAYPSQAVGTVAESEILRRAEAARAADAAILAARDQAARGEVAQALDALAATRARLPESPATLATRAAARDAFSSIAIAEAGKQAAEGKLDESRLLLARVLAPDMDPDNRVASKLLRDLDDPVRYPPGNSVVLGDKRAFVTEQLRLGESAQLLADYDAAIRAYEEVLRVDRYNTAAREGMERVERAIIDHQASAYNHRRAQMLGQVDKGWATNPQRTSIPTEAAIAGSDGSAAEIDARNRQDLLTRKMRTITVDSIALEGVGIRDAIRAVAAKSRAMDNDAADPAARGINLLLDIGADTEPFAAKVLAAEIQLRLANVPLSAVVEYLARQVGLGVRVESHAVLLVPPGDADTHLFTRSYNVPPDFIAMVPTDAAGAAGNDPFAPASGAGGLALKRVSPKEFLEQSGVTFPKNAFAVFDARTSTLSMSNTAANHELVEGMVAQARSTITPQVVVETKMIEVGETIVNELGFDWLLGAFGLDNGVAVAGGSGPALMRNNQFPFVDPGSGDPLGENPVTAGNRSGDTAFTTRTLNRLLDVQDTSKLAQSTLRAPGILSLAGVLSEPRFQMVIRALAQKKGTDFLNAPSVTTRSGLPAKIEVVREFIYPTEYDPPELPNSVGNTENGTFPVTPANPAAFDMKPIGSILEVEPVVGAGASIIEVNLEAIHREFIGFVNYGTPIASFVGNDPDNRVIITENRILQPVFETRRIKNSTSIYSGQTILIGGLIGEEKQIINDKAPLLGDLPLVGRFFKSDGASSSRKVLMIFLTVTALDHTGRPIKETYQQAATTQE